MRRRGRRVRTCTACAPKSTCRRGSCPGTHHLALRRCGAEVVRHWSAGDCCLGLVDDVLEDGFQLFGGHVIEGDLDADQHVVDSDEHSDDRSGWPGGAVKTDV